MAKPVVDGLERELGQVRLVRLNAMSREGREIAGRYAVRGVPTLIVFDGKGEPALKQTGRIERDSVLNIVAQLVSNISSPAR